MSDPALLPVGVRPGLPSYLAQLWQGRAFLAALVRGRVAAAAGTTRLGWVWLAASPLLNACLFYVVFGVLLGTRDTVADYALFLITGVLLYTAFQRVVQAEAGALRANRDLIRTLPFPRLSIPLSAAGVELLQAAWAVPVLLACGLIAGGGVSGWPTALAGILLMAILATGLGILLARICASVPDLGRLLPFGLRGAAFLSGVYFPLQQASDQLPVLGPLLQANPVAVLLDVVRAGLTGEQASAASWSIATLSSVVLMVVAVVAFWAREPKYESD